MTTRASTDVGADPTRGPGTSPREGRSPHSSPGSWRMSSSLAVAAAILLPIVYAVLGGFKSNGQLAAQSRVAPP